MTPDATRVEIPVPPSDLAEPATDFDTDAFAARITGIGGTGVVTVSQVLGTAAGRDGFEVRGLDQIGLSQKAGPVVSDLRLRRGRAAETNRLGTGQADLILAFDALVAASETGTKTARAGHTAVVGSTTRTPTGSMITQPAIALPADDDLQQRIASVSDPTRQHWADATAITTALFGDAVTANLFVVGMAYQAGCLPIRAKSIEWALELNGVAVERNRAAFRWGRAQIEAPEVVAQAVQPRARAPIACGAAALRRARRTLQSARPGRRRARSAAAPAHRRSRLLPERTTRAAASTTSWLA